MHTSYPHAHCLTEVRDEVNIDPSMPHRRVTDSIIHDGVG